EGGVQRLVVADAAGELDGDIDLADDLPEQVRIAAPAERRVEVDEMDPLRAIGLPLQRCLERVAVRRLRTGLPLHEAHGLADGAAGWLQQQWSQRSAYDDARAAVIAHVNDRAGALDERVVEQAAAVADREEAAALSAMLHRVTAHRMWSGDADRARDAAAA